jgi:4-hydroxybenzoate polyprenyltransferase
MNFNGVSFQLVFFRRFIFMFILCLLFDIRDVEVDKTEAINTLPVRIGINKSYLLCYVFLALFVSLTLIEFLYNPEPGQFWVMLISALATLLTVQYSRKNNSDFVYLACVDGMMLLQAVMVILTSI